MFVVLTLVQNVGVRVQEFAQVMLAVLVAQQAAPAFLAMKALYGWYLADRTQYTDDHVDVADVEHRHHQVNGTEVARTRSDILPAGLANFGFGRDAETPIQHSVGHGFTALLAENISKNRSSPANIT